jgi:hypothetical protein
MRGDSQLVAKQV